MSEMLCVGFESALAVWRAVGARVARDNPPSAERRPLLVRLLFEEGRDVDLSSLPPTSPVTRVPDRVEIESVWAFREAWPEVGGELHLCVSRQSGRRFIRQARTHLLTGSYPEGSFHSIGDGLLVASPELAFLQATRYLGEEQLIEYGYELCGLYARVGAAPGFCSCPQLTTRDRIMEFLDRVERLRLERGEGMPWGLRRARRAIAHVLDRAASPEEAAVSMMLSLPGRLGGYGLPSPRLNERLRLSEGVIRMFGIDEFVCDLSWNGGGTVLEYQGVQHKERSRWSYDLRKGNVLVADDRKVIHVDRSMLSTQDRMDEVAKLVARALGRTWRKADARTLTRRLCLRRDLLVSLDA